MDFHPIPKIYKRKSHNDNDDYDDDADNVDDDDEVNVWTDALDIITCK